MLNKYMLVDQYIGFFKFICTYLVHVEVKRISQKIQKISADKMQKNGYSYTLQIKMSLLNTCNFTENRQGPKK